MLHEIDVVMNTRWLPHSFWNSIWKQRYIWTMYFGAEYFKFKNRTKVNVLLTLADDAKRMYKNFSFYYMIRLHAENRFLAQVRRILWAISCLKRYQNRSVRVVPRSLIRTLMCVTNQIIVSPNGHYKSGLIVDGSN